jgi:hypothetical protein
VLAYTTLLEDLASHGYVVTAIEPTYNVPAVQFPDGKVVRRLASAERGWDRPRNRDEFQRVYPAQVVHWVRDMSFVLDRLTALDKEEGLFSHRLDLARVGAFGYSRGGQAAGTVRLLDSRFVAASISTAMSRAGAFSRSREATAESRLSYGSRINFDVPPKANFSRRESPRRNSKTSMQTATARCSGSKATACASPSHAWHVRGLVTWISPTVPTGTSPQRLKSGLESSERWL